MLAELDDPYTRLLMPEENSALEAEEQGKVVSTGLGLQQLQVPSAAGAAGCGAGPSEQQTEPQPLLVVSFVVEGSPAAAAGIKAGDAVLDIKGQPVAGKELRDVYKLLSQEADVTLVRQPGLTGQQGSTRSSAAADADGSGSSSVPRPQCMTDAAAAAAAGCGADGGLLQDAEVYSVHLEPAPLDFEPVQYGIVDLSQQLPSADTPVDGSSSSQASGHVGYLKIVTFSATSPQAAAEALQDMQQEAAGLPGGLSGLIVDLRDNPGGIVEAGVDIAQDFLHAGQVLCIVVDKTGQEERVVLPEAHTLTEVPLAVLVNHSTASTSELLAGTLRDELHAPLIGTTTYGKGRTQRVIPLSDGKSTLLVSTLKYFTPQHTTIDKEGLVPDVVCSPDAVLGQQWVGGDVGQGAGSLLDDPCIKLAAERLTQVEVS